jgi:hypothetical protein
LPTATLPPHRGTRSHPRPAGTRPSPDPRRAGHPRRQEASPGRDFEAFISSGLGAHLIRPDRKDEPARFGKLARQRQWIEAISGTLKGELTLEAQGGRTPAGVYARAAARLLALAAAIWNNWRTGAPSNAP